MKKFTPLWIGLGLLVLLGLWAMASYNGLVTSKAGVDNAWAQVETQYQRRMDLVPNLVSTVKGAANFEQSTLTAVTEARTKYLSAGTLNDKVAAAGQFDSALSRLLVSVEAYPQLTATQNFRELQAQLEGTENRISVARKDFNDAVMVYNVRVQRFPSVIAARLFGFSTVSSFQAQSGAENAPKVDFTQ